MPHKPIVPCVWSDHQAEAVAAFYTGIFPGGRVLATSRYPESLDTPGGQPRGSVLTVEFEIAGQPFTALNGGPQFKINPSLSFFVHVATADAANALFEALADGGSVLMPIDAYPWSERYGWVQDRFGVSWQVLTGRPAVGGATIVPSLMFVGAQAGRAEEAMRAYVAAFPGSGLDDVARYEEGEGPVGAIKHGRFRLAGQDMIAADSHYPHGFAFNEAVSLQVMCADQREVDHYWSALAEGGGEAGPCGWLKDRFGVSWQVVPRHFEQWLASDDAARRDRVFETLLRMGKPDIATLQAAFEGE